MPVNPAPAKPWDSARAVRRCHFLKRLAEWPYAQRCTTDAPPGERYCTAHREAGRHQHA